VQIEKRPWLPYKRGINGETEGIPMIRISVVSALTALVMTTSMQTAPAQDNTIGGALLGGAAGAIIGGAATGKAGGAVAGGIIGAAAGAAIGSQFEPRRGGYYWYDDRCWRRYGDGSYHRVSRRYCY
jgi:Glycine zipper